MINDIISKLQNKGIKIEKTKSRQAVFQGIFNRSSSEYTFLSYDSLHAEKKLFVHNNSMHNL